MRIIHDPEEIMHETMGIIHDPEEIMHETMEIIREIPDFKDPKPAFMRDQVGLIREKPANTRMTHRQTYADPGACHGSLLSIRDDLLKKGEAAR